MFRGGSSHCAGVDEKYYFLTIDNTPLVSAVSPTDLVTSPFNIVGTAEFTPTSYSGKGTINVYLDGRFLGSKSCNTETCSFDFQAVYGFLYPVPAAGLHAVTFIASGCGASATDEQPFYAGDPEDDHCGGDVGKPVNVASGRTTLRKTDFSVKGVTTIDFTRYYSSRANVAGGFGQGWSHNFDIRVSGPLGLRSYKVSNPDGSMVSYTDTDGDGVYDVTLPKGERSRLTKNTDNTFVREHLDGAKEEFNTAGYLTAVVDKNGNRITLTRAGNNSLTAITDPAGRQITVTNDASGKITSLTTPDGKVFTYTYPSPGLLGTAVYPDGSRIAYEYVYASGYKLSRVKDENNHYIETHTYSSNGKAITSSADGTNDLLTINYISGTQSTVTDSLGRMTTYTIDKSGGKSRVTDISGPGCTECGQTDVSYTYDDDLNRTSVTDANGNMTTYTYDANGNALTKTEASGTPAERTTTYTYNSSGQPLTITDPAGNTTTLTYDTQGNLLTTTDAAGDTTSFTYDCRGLMTSMTDAQGHVTDYTYDQYGNLASSSDPLGRTTTYTYDVMGRILSTTDANGNQTNYTYDQRGRLTQVRDGLDQVTTYTYDSGGNLTAVTDANNHTTHFTYDSINRLIGETNALGNDINYTYNSASKLVSKTDANDQATTYNYDDHNRLSAVNHPEGTQTTFTYDNIGNMTGATNSNISYTFTYDPLKRKTAVTDSLGRTIGYTYDANSNRLSMTDPAGGVTRYTYNQVNLPTAITDPLDRTTSYAYDNLRRRTGLTLPNAIAVSYTYDSVNRLLSIINGTVSTNSYVYDSAGNRTGMTDNAGTHNYVYDAIYRLNQATHPAPPAEQFTYDPVGNRLTDGWGSSYSYNNANRLLGYDGVTFTYDANGNTTSREDICGTTVYTWDSENRLTGINGFQPACGALTASYKYDAFGRRIEKNVNGAVTKYLYDEQDILAEYDGDDQLVSRYVHGKGIDELISLTRAGQTYFYHTDALGSVIAITDAAGDVVQRYEYDSFGNIVSLLDPDFIQPFTYTGREYDPESGLYYYRARYYDAEMGRFISEDPIGLLGGINLFAYVSNNPVNLTDPTGLKGCGPGTIGDWLIPDDWPSYSFGKCCNDHDDCYDCKSGKSRDAFDEEFCGCLLRQCEKLDGDSRRSCEGNAKLYCSKVKKYGGKYYKGGK
jgi:RHS repeat-associated protein